MTMSSAKASILVVDDDPSVRCFLKELLIDNGYQVVAVESGEAALERIAAQEFDLALIDLKMKGIGGIEVLQALRQQAPDTVAIILTGHGSIGTAIEALRQGAHDYLFKPCRTEELRESVSSGLNERRRMLRQRAESSFASHVSHELRNPLTTIDLHLRLLEKGKPQERKRYLEVLKQEARQMERLIEGTLTISRLKAGEARVEFAPQDLNELVEQVVTAHRPSAEIAGLELIFEPGADLPPVRAVRDQLVQVVTNLVANAINYTLAGQVKVSTYLDAELKQIRLQIQDTGIGIEPEDLPHVFERFYRGPRATESGIPGTGLGLAIVKAIVDLHGGEIEVESQVGAGSTFRIWLPLEPTPGSS